MEFSEAFAVCGSIGYIVCASIGGDVSLPDPRQPSPAPWLTLRGAL
jgi:hypothetical protein